MMPKANQEIVIFFFFYYVFQEVFRRPRGPTG